MDIQAYEDFLKSINLMETEKMVFLYETEKEKGIRAVRSAIVENEELGNFVHQNGEVKKYFVKDDERGNV